MATHYLKCINPYFQDILDGRKTLEIRKNDRNYKEGDFLVLGEGKADAQAPRAVLVKVVGVLTSAANSMSEEDIGLKEGFVGLSIERIMNLSDNGDVGITPTVMMWVDNARRIQAQQQAPQPVAQ